MAQSFSLQPLLELMQERTDDATRQLGKLIAAEQNAKRQLQMLEQYRQEYNDRLRAAATQGLTPLALRNYQDFLGRIDQAIAQQTRAVRASEQQTLDGQNHWQDQNRQLKAIDTLAQRHDARERAREGKREQKILDEYSSRKYAHQSDPDTPE